MPVLLPPLQEPTDVLMAGEQLRTLALAAPVAVSPAQNFGAVAPLVANDQTPLGMQLDGITQYVQWTYIDGSLVRNNAVISTPCGALIPFEIGLRLMNNGLVGHTGRWAVSGATLDGPGAPLADCRVIAHETGRLDLGEGASIVGETLSDGSGNYSIEVWGNVALQLTAYKPGSPDVAGITRNDVIPVAAP